MLCMIHDVTLHSTNTLEGQETKPEKPSQSRRQNESHSSQRKNHDFGREEPNEQNMTPTDFLNLPIFPSVKGNGVYIGLALEDGIRLKLPENINSESENGLCESSKLVDQQHWEQMRNAECVYRGMDGSKFDIYLQTQILAALFTENTGIDEPWSAEHASEAYLVVERFIDRLDECCNHNKKMGFGSDEVIAELHNIVILFVNRCMGNSKTPPSTGALLAAHRALIKFFKVAGGGDTRQVESWVQDQEEAFDYIAQGLIELAELNEAEIVLREACGVCKRRTSVFLAMRAEVAEANGNLKLAHELYQKLGDTTLSSFYDDDEPNWMAGLGERCPLGTWAERVHRTAS